MSATAEEEAGGGVGFKTQTALLNGTAEILHFTSLSFLAFTVLYMHTAQHHLSINALVHLWQPPWYQNLVYTSPRDASVTPFSRIFREMPLSMTHAHSQIEKIHKSTPFHDHFAIFHISIFEIRFQGLVPLRKSQISWPAPGLKRQEMEISERKIPERIAVSLVRKNENVQDEFREMLRRPSCSLLQIRSYKRMACRIKSRSSFSAANGEKQVGKISTL